MFDFQIVCSREVFLTYSRALKNVDTEFADFTKMRVAKLNRTERVWTGNMTFFVDVGDDYEMETKLFRSTGHQYKQTPYRLARKTFCIALQNDPNFDDLRQVSNFPAKEVCPWPKGKYEIYGSKVTKLSRWPPSSDGDYMIETRFYKNDELLNGYQVFVTII